MSLHSAVTTEVSLASPSAGSGRGVAARVQEQGGQLLGVGGAAAVAEGQQPPARGEPGGGVGGAGHQPGAVALADHPAQLDDLLGLGHRGLAHLLQHGGQVGGAGVQERVERLHRPRAWLRPGRITGHLPTTAIASLACTRIVSPTRRADQRDADLFLALAGVHDGQPVVEQAHDP